MLPKTRRAMWRQLEARRRARFPELGLPKPWRMRKVGWPWRRFRMLPYDDQRTDWGWTTKDENEGPRHSSARRFFTRIMRKRARAYNRRLVESERNEWLEFEEYHAFC